MSSGIFGARQKCIATVEAWTDDAATRISLGALAVLALIDGGCSDSKQTDTNGTVTNPQKDQDPTPDTGTGGDQQGTVPAQPAQPAQ